jgi:hypothetical protein
LLLVLASAVPLGHGPFGIQYHSLLFQFLRLSQPGEPGPWISIPWNRVAQIYPRALGSLSVVSYDSQRYDGGILSLLHTGYHGVNRHSYIYIYIYIYIYNKRGGKRMNNLKPKESVLDYSENNPTITLHLSFKHNHLFHGHDLTKEMLL